MARLTATQPMDKQATRKADEEIYSRHAKDPRPNALYDEKGNRLSLDPCDPAHASLRQEWLDIYRHKGGKVTVTEEAPFCSGPPPKRVEIAVIPCPESDCVIRAITVRCEDYGKKRNYQLQVPVDPTSKVDLRDNEWVLEVITNPNEDNKHKLKLQTQVVKPLCVNHQPDHFAITSSRDADFPEFKAGPDADYEVAWARDTSAWWKYLWPFSTEPVTYSISPRACAQEFSPLDVEVRAYPAVELNVKFKIDLKRGRDYEHATELKLVIKIGTKTIETANLIEATKTLITWVRRFLGMLETVTKEMAKQEGIDPHVSWPAVGFELNLSNEEDPDRGMIRWKYGIKLTGTPIIGLKLEGDLMEPIIRIVEKRAAAAFPIGTAAAALLHVLDFARKRLGAGIFANGEAKISGEIARSVPPWPNGEMTGKLSDEFGITLEARAADNGSSFVVKWLSKFRIGGTTGFEFSITDIGCDKVGVYIVSSVKWTGVTCYYGRASSLKTTTEEYDASKHVADSKTGTIIFPEHEFWKDEKTYLWHNAAGPDDVGS